MSTTTWPRPDGNGVYLSEVNTGQRYHDMSVKVIDGEVRISMGARNVDVQTLQAALSEAYKLQEVSK